MALVAGIQWVSSSARRAFISPGRAAMMGRASRCRKRVRPALGTPVFGEIAAMTEFAIEEAMERALGYHRAGDWSRAEELYRSVLAAVPDHADALHLLGVLASQSG